MTKAQNLPLEAPTGFYPFSTSRASNYDVYQSGLYGLNDMGVGSCPDKKLGPIEPKLPQKVQACIEASFNSLGEQTDMAQNFHVKLPPEFDQIQMNKNKLAEDMGVKIQPQIDINPILPPPLYGNLGESTNLRDHKKLKANYELQDKNEELLYNYKGFNTHDLVSYNQGVDPSKFPANAHIAMNAACVSPEPGNPKLQKHVINDNMTQ